MRKKLKNQKVIWEFYVELVGMLSVQTNQPDLGDERTILNSLYSLYIKGQQALIRSKGSRSICELIIPINEEVLHPFLKRWFGIKKSGELLLKNKDFGKELVELQKVLREHAKLISGATSLPDLLYLKSMANVWFPNGTANDEKAVYWKTKGDFRTTVHEKIAEIQKSFKEVELSGANCLTPYTSDYELLQDIETMVDELEKYCRS